MRAGLLARAYLPGPETRALRQLLRYRAFLVDIRRAVKNRIHARPEQVLPPPPVATLFSRRGPEWLQSLQLSRPYGEELGELLRLPGALAAELEAVARRVQAQAKGDPRALLLATIPGVGRHTALLILAEIGDISRFPSARHLGSYAGLVPSTCASWGKARHGAITRQGSPFLPWALVEAAIHAVRTSGPLGGFCRRLLPGKGAQQARVAAARKTNTAVYWLLVTNRTFREVEPYLAPRGQASSAPPMASR